MAAAGFAVSTSLQHRANAQLAHREAAGRPPVRAALLRQPWWLVGQLIAFASFGLHAWALRVGMLVVVQPVVVSGIVLAVPVRAALERRLPRLDEVATVAMTAVGLVGFLIAARPAADSAATGPVDQGVALVAVGLSGAAAVAAAWWAGRRRGSARAGAYGVASGVLFGLTAGLVKLTVVAASSALAAAGPGGTVLALASSWPVWLVAPVGIAGVVLNQRAYRSGPLSASMPLLNVIDVLLAVAFGVVVFGETPAHGPLDLLGQLLGVVLVVLGLRRLARAESANDEFPAPPAPPRVDQDPAYSRSLL